MDMYQKRKIRAEKKNNDSQKSFSKVPISWYPGHMAKTRRLIKENINMVDIIYEVVDEEGPAHNKKFTSIVKVDGIIMGRGTAGSKKASEQEAAKDALSKRAGIK